MADGLEISAISVVIDLFIASLGAIGIFVYKQLGKKILTRNGFFCGDETLAYPYKGSTIPAWLNGAVGVIVPTIIIAADMVVKFKIEKSKSLKTYLSLTFPILITFYAGCSIQHIFTDVAKYQIGRLRPHFFDVCHPEFELNGAMVNCSTALASDWKPFTYVPEFQCTNDKYTSSRQTEAQLSFPSGHVSFATYAMTFAFFYVHFRLPRRFATFLGEVPRPFLQFACLWWAWFVGISRLFDNKHHASDILSGGLIGVLVAAFFAFGVLSFHKDNERDGKSVSKSPSAEELPTRP